MLCRNVEKAEAAADDIRKDTGSVVVVMKCDLSSLESVRQCAAKLVEDEGKIDLLVNNAGEHQKKHVDNLKQFDLKMIGLQE